MESIGANPVFLVSGAGMALVALGSVFWWKRGGVRWWYFGWGAFAWAVGVALKFLWAFLLNRRIYELLRASFPENVSNPLFWAYVGLLTGFFECGIVLLLGRWLEGLREAGWREAVGFGVGFGAVEALLLGLSSLATVIIVLTAPEKLPPAVLKQFAMRGGAILWALAPIVERASAILVHVFSNVLIILSLRSRLWKWFWLSFIYKTAVDSFAAFAQLSYGLGTLRHLWTVELVVVIFGLVGLWGTGAVKGKFEGGVQG